MILISRLYYNEFDAIKNTHPRYTKVHYIDGRFPLFPKMNDSDYSTDYSNDLIDSYPNTERFECYGSILQKTNFQFKKAVNYDIMIMLSCDEYLTGDWEQFQKDLSWEMKKHPDQKIFNIAFEVISGDDRPIKSKDRIFIDPVNWSVSERHWLYKYKGQEQHLRPYYVDPHISSLKIIHDDSIRSKTRNDLMAVYQGIPEELTDV